MTPPKCFIMSRKFYGTLILIQKGLLLPIGTSINNAPTWLTITLVCALALITTAVELSDIAEK